VTPSPADSRPARATPGDVCLQGGAELRPGCEAMDAAMLWAHGPGLGSEGLARRVVVVPFAGRPGRERAVAGANADGWYRRLGARDVDVVLDEGPGFGDLLAQLTGPDDGTDGTPDGPPVRPPRGGDLLVLPGGSPSRLLAALAPHRDALAAALARGVAVSGASAGAMVLCRWTVLPEGGRPRVVDGLGLVPVDLVLVHFSGGSGWLDVARAVLPPDAVVLGLPERSGAVLRPDGTLEAAGVASFTRLAV
jgi:cyanophycinase-like exopeptidase